MSDARSDAMGEAVDIKELALKVELTEKLNRRQITAKEADKQLKAYQRKKKTMGEKVAKKAKKRRPTSTKACKAKARRLQNETAEALRQMAKDLLLGLSEEDIMPREMGQSGVDVRMSPEATRKMGLIEIECKNTERFNAISVFNKHAKTYKDTEGLKAVIHTRNGSGSVAQPRLVLITLEDFIALLRDRIERKLILEDIKAGNFNNS